MSCPMNNELFERIVMFKATMSLVKSMLSEGLISEEEYSEIDRIFASKYGLDLSVLFR